jgi:hypothetical protein
MMDPKTILSMIEATDPACRRCRAELPEGSYMPWCETCAPAALASRSVSRRS